MQTSTKRPPKVTFNPFVRIRFAIAAAKQKIYDTLQMNLLEGKQEWMLPTVKYVRQHPPLREQGARETARRRRQLEAGIIHLN